MPRLASPLLGLPIAQNGILAGGTKELERFEFGSFGVALVLLDEDLKRADPLELNELELGLCVLCLRNCKRMERSFEFRGD